MTAMPEATGQNDSTVEKGLIDIRQMFEIPAVERSDPARLCIDPLVSVVMITYNHEKYLRDAVDSVAAQQCDFAIELLIGEDHSTDGTLRVAMECMDRHPQMIRVISSDTNVGIGRNLMRILCRARGQYIAILDGDDLWIDPLKLHKQVSLLGAHPEWTLCGGRSRGKAFHMPVKDIYSLEEVLRRYIWHSSSVLFRTSIVRQLPAEFLDGICYDAIIYALCAEQGHCALVDGEVSFYRRHAAGVWTGGSVEKQLSGIWPFTSAMERHFGGRYHKELIDRELWILRMMTALRLDEGYLDQWSYCLQAMRLELPRLLPVFPLSSLAWAFGILALPVRLAYARFRRGLAIRRRIEEATHLLRGNRQ